MAGGDSNGTAGQAFDQHSAQRPTYGTGKAQAADATVPGEQSAGAAENRDAGQEETNIVPLTRAEAEQLFGANVSRPSRVTPFRVVAAQMVVSLVAALICWLFLSQPGDAARSALLGGAICWVPGALFALRLRMVGHRQSMFGWMVGEAIKMGVTIAMFVAIAKYVPDLRWLPLLITYLVALKTYWVALALR
jgi:ATP synthase protein I